MPLLLNDGKVIVVFFIAPSCLTALCVHAAFVLKMCSVRSVFLVGGNWFKSPESSLIMVQVPVIQVLLGNTGIVTSKQMFSQWRYVVVGATVAAAVLTPSTDPFTQTLLAVPLIGLYLGGAACVRLIEGQRASPQQS